MVINRKFIQDSDCEEIQHEILCTKITQAAIALGLNHPEVLTHSQKLDEKHNLILQLKYKHQASEVSISV